MQVAVSLGVGAGMHIADTQCKVQETLLLALSCWMALLRTGMTVHFLGGKAFHTCAVVIDPLLAGIAWSQADHQQLLLLMMYNFRWDGQLELCLHLTGYTSRASELPRMWNCCLDALDWKAYARALPDDQDMNGECCARNTSEWSTNAGIHWSGSQGMKSEHYSVETADQRLERWHRGTWRVSTTLLHW